MKEFKLKIDLLPRGAWYNDFSKTLSQNEWNTIREKCYQRANGVCEICGAKTDKLNAHEMWNFDIESKTQTLVKIIAICTKCHGVIHYRNTQRLGFAENAKKHFMNINKCSELDFASHLAEAILLYEERNSVYRWKIKADLSEYDKKIIIEQPNLPFILSPYKNDDIDQLQNQINLTPNICAFNIDNYRGMITLKCRNTNRVEWYDNNNNLLATNYFFSKCPIAEFCVKDLECQSIFFKLKGISGEFISKPLILKNQYLQPNLL